MSTAFNVNVSNASRGGSFHLAAMAAVRYSVQHPLIYGQANVQASLNQLGLAFALLCGLQAALFGSTLMLLRSPVRRIRRALEINQARI